MQHMIITISRQFGSGGREIGKALSKKYDIDFFDKELLEEAAKKSGISKELFEMHDEKPTNSFLFSLVADGYFTGYNSINAFNDMPLSQKVFLAQFDAIKTLAKEQSCVIVGRCADYALANMPHIINVFVYADIELRVKRIAKCFDISEEKARDMIQKTDKKRASYYNYYTNKKWGECISYNLSIDSGKLGIQGSVDAISNYIELVNRDHKEIYEDLGGANYDN